MMKKSSKNRVILLSVIDNLIKGGAGQAIQNMNIKFDFNETVGLLFYGNLDMCLFCSFYIKLHLYVCPSYESSSYHFDWKLNHKDDTQEISFLMFIFA